MTLLRILLILNVLNADCFVTGFVCFSSKFALKLHYVRSLSELSHLMPTEYIHLPEEVKE